MKIFFLLLSLVSSSLLAGETDVNLSSKITSASESVMRSALRSQAPGVSLRSVEARDLGTFESIQNVLSLGVGFSFGESSNNNVHYKIVESDVVKNGNVVKINCLMRFEFKAELSVNVHVQKCQNSGQDILSRFSSEVTVVSDNLGDKRRSYSLRLSERAEWGSHASINSDRSERDFSATITTSPRTGTAAQY